MVANVYVLLYYWLYVPSVGLIFVLLFDFYYARSLKFGLLYFKI